MEEQNGNGDVKKSKSKKSKSKKESDPSLDEVRQFKENLLQAAASQDGGSILSESANEISVPPPARSRSASRARDALNLPASVLAELDENKIFELKEAFLLFDLDGDGCIDINDLRGTFISLGEKVDEQLVQKMLSEASNPLDFDAFVNLLGYKTLELDSEETLVAALSRWDQDNTGLISEDKIRQDLMTRGDCFTEKEADYALDEAPIVQKGGYNMIDYKQFCSKLCGLRKTDKSKLQAK